MNARTCSMRGSFAHARKGGANEINRSTDQADCRQFEAQAVPEESQLLPELNRLFGDHTFFLGRAGLHIIDPTVSTEAGAPTGRIVKLATWTDSHRTTLAPHEPEFTGVIIPLDEAA